MAKLPDDVRAWLDAEQLPDAPAGRFNQRIDPARLLDPSSGAVWGGLMLPDSLPLVSDGGGNALCLRFGFDGTVAEVIHWDHEGSLWKPFGRTLAEALVLDAAFSLIDQIENDGEADSIFIEESFPLADWATDWLPGLSKPILRSLLKDVPSLPARLRELGLARVAIAQWQCQRLLTNRLDRFCRRVGGGKIAKTVGVDWSEFRRWLADARLIPEDQKQQLSTLTTIPFDELIYQDWETAASEARDVLDVRSDLAWPFAVLGRYNERTGNIHAALGYYLRAMETLGTSQDFTASWSVLSNTRYKFAAGRLMELSRGTSELSDRDHYLEALATSKPGKAVRQYWFERAERAEKAGDFRGAYECYYKSGWDNPISDEIDLVLDQLVRTAREAGSAPLSSLAARHRLAIST